MIKYTEKEFKSIINKRKFIDSWFWDRYSINAYNGCQFGCIYCDSDEDLKSMVKTAKESGADYLIFGAGMTMRDLQSVWFMNHLYDRFPGLTELYEKLYRFKYNKDAYAGMYEPGQQYSQQLNQKMLSLCEKFNLQYRIKRYIPEDFRKSNYIISEKLLNRSYQLQIMRKDWKNIYWAGMNIQNLKESIADVATRNELRNIRNVNSDIENFIRDQLLNYS